MDFMRPGFLCVFSGPPYKDTFDTHTPHPLPGAPCTIRTCFISFLSFSTYLSWGSDLGFIYIYMTRFICYPPTQKHDMLILIRSHWARLVHDLLAAMNMVMVDLVVPLFSLSIL